MEQRKANDGENTIEPYIFPLTSDSWNAHITKVAKLGTMQVAGCVYPQLNLSQCNLVIFVFPETTRDDISKNWDQIKEIRDNLSSAQGIFRFSEFSFRQMLYQLHNEFNLGYGEIAHFLNFEFLVLASIGFEFIIGDGFLEPEFVLEIMTDYLSSLGLSFEEYGTNLTKIKDQIGKGNAPWDLDNGPFEKEIIRETVRSFTKVVKKMDVVLDPRNELFSIFLHEDIFMSFAIKLLKKTNSLNISRQLAEINRWIGLRAKIRSYLIKHQNDYFPFPVGMGDLDQFFP